MGVISMKVLLTISQNVEKRRTQILEKIRKESQSLTQLRRYFRGSISDAILKHDLKNFQKMGVVKAVKFKGYERVFFYMK
jgi:DNA-binding HxlR family transcriptional regulator